MHRFFADERGIVENIAYLNAEDAGHALRVLRLENGDEVELVCAPARYLAEIDSTEDGEVRLRVTEKLRDTETQTRVTLYQGLPKADKMEWIVQKSTELGAAAIAIVAATLAVSVLFSRVLSRPIHDLISAMEAFEKNADNFVYEPVSGVREVQDLSSSFAHLVRKIQQLMATVRAEEVNLRKTELRALQAQINPHFLYNTLDSISWMCEQGKNKDAVVMVNALAQLFRISISKGHELIPIRSEVQHAKSYLQIQSVRYKDQFSYRFEVDESCLDYLCNKITLQPIIENAIYHGINGLVDEGEIIIRIESRGDDILATVEDNGVGMEPEQIEAIFRRSDTKSGIGIKNVNDRLKIWFGDAYGITIESEPDCGTRVMVRMPKKQKE